MKEILLKLFTIVLLLSSTKTFAQNQMVSGRVTAKDDGKPLPSVTVSVKGTSTGTQTDANGRFSIKVPSANATLVFSFIGYANQEASASGNLEIALASSQNQLDEVLVVAYGTANKKTFTGAVSQINNADFEKRPLTNVLSAVVGAAPGVSTTIASGAPGSSPGIRVRGFGSVNASNDALIVVDGAVYDGNFANINPDDVESISILKDAATTALYGSRGANGVVSVTTKKGKAGRNTLSFRVNNGWISRGLPEYDRVDAYQYYPLMWEAYRNSLVYGADRIPANIAANIASGLTNSYTLPNGTVRNYTAGGIKALLGYNPFNVADNQIINPDGTLNPNAQLKYADDLDWANATTQGGKKRQSYNMTYSGGADKTDFFGSFNYTDEQGYLIQSRLKRFTGRLNVNSQITKWFKTGANLTGNYNDLKYDNVPTDGGSSFINPFWLSRYMGPIYPIYQHDPTTGAYILDANGERIYDFGSARPFSQGRHAIFENSVDRQSQIRASINSRFYATINFTKDLKLTTNLAFDIQDNHEREYDNNVLGDGAPAGRANHGFYRTLNYTLNQLLEYSKDIGQHHFDVVAGHENYLRRYNELTAGRNGLVFDGNIELPNFATITAGNSLEHNSRVESYLSRLNYNFDQKYLLSASLRRDGNSVIAPDGRWQNFWSLGLGWNISQEDFFKVNWIDQLKLRGSYGQVGNAQGIGYYPYQAQYGLNRNNQAEPGAIQTVLPNPNLRWETAKSLDLGIDFSMLKGRLGGSVSYFDRITDGLIFEVPQPSSNGGTTTTANYVISQNIGSLYNRGFELELTGQIVKAKDFNYSLTLNLTKIKNKVTKMPPAVSRIVTSARQTAIAEGHSIYDHFTRIFYGVDPENGSALYKTNVITANTRVIGQDTVTTVIGEADQRWTGTTAIPDLQGSINQNFGYKNFYLSVLATFQLGGKVYDGAYAGLMHGGTYGTALSTDILNRWTPTNTTSNIPRLDVGNVANLAGASSRFLTSASYFQINTVNFGYNLPKAWLSKINAKGASIYFSAENLALFTARKGMNVVGSFNGTVNNSYNFNRIVSLGVNVNF